MLEHVGGLCMRGVGVLHVREYLTMRKFNEPVLKIFGLGAPKPKPVKQFSAAEQTAADEAAARTAAEAEAGAAKRRGGRRLTLLAGSKTPITSLGTAKTSLLGSSAT